MIFLNLEILNFFYYFPKSTFQDPIKFSNIKTESSVSSIMKMIMMHLYKQNKEEDR